jgi:S1-C subfamily serine protease/Tfp pilus assembly protein PilF
MPNEPLQTARSESIQASPPRNSRSLLFSAAIIAVAFAASAAMAWPFFAKGHLINAAEDNTPQREDKLLKRVQDLEREIADRKTVKTEAALLGHGQLSPDKIFAQASPAVVQIVMNDADGSRIGQGSVFLVDERGLVATNYHVVQNAHSVQVVLSDSTRVPVLGVTAFDKAVDIAIIRLDREINLRRLEMAPFELPPVGTKVYAIGNPLGLANTLSDGLVSALRDRETYPVIQITTPISPGSSGGPLLREDGKVCGVTTFVFRGGQNLNFAVPIAHVVRLLTACQDEDHVTSLPLVERYPSTPTIMTDMAEERAAKSIPDARDAYPMSYWSRGLWWNHKREYVKAAQEFSHAILLEPNNWLFHYYRGMTWMEFGDLDEAIHNFDRTVLVKPNDAGALTMRGKCWLRKHQPDRALEDFNEAVKTKPPWVTAYASRALAWSAKQKYAEAAADFEIAFQLGGGGTASFLYRDFAWFLATCPKREFRNGKRALLLAKIAADITKWKSGRELNALAAAYAEIGQFDQAIRYQTEALEDPVCLPRYSQMLWVAG